MCESNPLRCDCHEWAQPNAPRKADIDKARTALTEAAPGEYTIDDGEREWKFEGAAPRRRRRMTKFRIEWDYDPDDQTAHRLDLDTDKGGRFFAAWVNPGTDAIEWTSTDAEYPGGPHFEGLARLMEESAS